MAKHKSAQMSKITNDTSTRYGTGCFIAVPTWRKVGVKGLRCGQSNALASIIPGHRVYMCLCVCIVLTDAH